jgi:hypothetical protein
MADKIQRNCREVAKGNKDNIKHKKQKSHIKSFSCLTSSEAKITFFYDSEKSAIAVERGVSPDNFQCPPRLIVNTTRIGTSVTHFVKNEDRFLTFLSTIDDLLMAIQVSEKTISAILSEF